MSVQLPSGYKQTEAGTIPDEWNVAELQQICAETITYGIVQCGPHLENGVPYIRVSDMNDRELDVNGMLRTSPEIAHQFSRSKVNEGDVVYALRGKIGEVRPIHSGVAGANLTQGTARLSPSTQVLTNYLVWSLRGQSALKQGDLAAKGSTFREITLDALRKIQLPIPPLSEQKAIAEALSDADALIESLEQLVAKKRHLKQGTIQELLTGKKRLPGFSGEWEVKRLGNVAPLQRGFDLPNPQLRQGPFPVVYSNGVLNYHAAFQVKGPGVVTGRSGTIGKVNFVEQDYWPHNTTLWVTSFKSNDPKYIYYLLGRIGLEQFSTGSGVPTLNRNDVHDYMVSIPPSISEQVAIATVLSDMDAEIAELETRLTKTRALKQGMMHKLLTAEIRLI